MKSDKDKSNEIAEHLVSVMLKREPKHKEAFEEWIEENPTATDVLHELVNDDVLNDELKNFSIIDKQKSAQRMLQKISVRRRKALFTKTVSVAAALITVSFLVWQYGSFNEKPVVEREIANVETLGVKLIIDESEEVELNKDTIMSQTLQLHKTGENEVAYTQIGSKVVTKNRLIVPNREKFTIKLSDGTKVMLNAQSELIFPSEFMGDKREVTIRGEAFFEVAKDSNRPFIVHCDTIAIQVYGTVFNVNNRESFSTFLCEGSIGVSINNKSQQMLSPNQLIKIENGVSKIETVKNSEKYIDWTTGYFIFDADEMKYVIEKLSQWYGVELIIDGISHQSLITGSFDRSLNLDDIIKSIEEVSGVKLLKK